MINASATRAHHVAEKRTEPVRVLDRHAVRRGNRVDGHRAELRASIGRQSLDPLALDAELRHTVDDVLRDDERCSR